MCSFFAPPQAQIGQFRFLRFRGAGVRCLAPVAENWPVIKSSAEEKENEDQFRDIDKLSDLAVLD